ncbi:MAG: glycosyltransferase family 1 protein [Phycisphaerales bacterium]|nr:MAG: glycosyltransferase family 1 protein [Phycisphaerales bacterium]
MTAAAGEPLRGRLIVCVASCWNYDPTSKHQIMKRLARHNDVLWINYRGTRRPALNGQDLRGIAGTLRRFARGLEEVDSGVRQLTPLVIPGAAGAWLGAVQRRLLIAQVQRALERTRQHPAQPVQIWCFAPDVPYLAGALGEEVFVYYCVDEFAKFDGVNSEYVRRLERRTLEVADVVIASSAQLAQTRGRVRRDVHLVRHGVEFDHFARAWREDGPRPGDLPHNGRPTLGFFGLVHHWVDVDLLADLARLRPEYNVVVIGDCKVDVSALQARPNVFLLGRKPYSTLPDYCRWFDAALLPFVCGPATHEINPIKLREYLAAGLRTIATPLPEALRYRGVVRFTDPRDGLAGAERFARLCDSVVACASTDPQQARASRQRIAQTVASETWEGVVDRLTAIVCGERVSRAACAAARSLTPARPLSAPPVARTA